MKLVIEREALKESLVVVGNTTSRLNPALTCVRIEAIGTSVTFCCTDAETMVKHNVTAEVEDEGVVLVDVRCLKGFVDKADEPFIELSTDDKMLLVKAGRSKIRINLSDVDLFPDAPSLQEGTKATFEATALLDALKAVVPCASTEESRLVLNGVYIEAGKNTKVVCTDGRRLAVKDVTAECEEDFSLNVPTPAVKAVLNAHGDQVVVRSTDELASLSCGNTEVITRLVCGNYPRWRQVVPSGTGGITISLDAKQVLKAIDVTSLSGSVYKSVLFEVKGSELLLSSHGDEKSVATSIALDGEQEKDVSISLSGLLLRQMVSVLETFTMNISDELSPITIKSDNYLGVIMPLRT